MKKYLVLFISLFTTLSVFGQKYTPTGPTDNVRFQTYKNGIPKYTLLEDVLKFSPRLDQLKTINGEPIYAIGGGNIVISGGGSATTDASQLTSGILPDSRLSANVALKTYVDTQIATRAPNTLAGFSSSAGVVTNGDSYTTVINKLNGNTATKAGLASPAFTGTPTVPTASAGTNTTQAASTAFANAAAALRQAQLVSGTNIKTINGATILGNGNLTISAVAAQALGYTDATTLGFVGDGVTDNSGKFGGNLKIYFPAGDYLFKSTNYLGSGIDILGAGGGKTIFRTNATFTGGINDAPIEFNGASNITIKGITFNGSGNAVPANSLSKRMLAFIKLNPFPNICKNVIIEDCVFQDGWSYGIRFGDGATDGTNYYENVHINRSVFERLYDPNHVEFNDEVDSQDNFMKCDAIYLNSLTREVEISHCNFLDLSGDGIFAFGNTTASANNIVNDDKWRGNNYHHNFFYKCWMSIENNGNSATSSRSIVDANISLFHRRINGGGYGISFSGDRAKITNNLIVATEMATAEIFGDNTTFEGNTIFMTVKKDGSSGVANASFRSGISISLLDLYGKNPVARNNLFVSDLKYDDATPLTSSVNGILLAGPSTYSPPYMGVIGGNSKDVIIENNTFIGMNKSFIQASVPGRPVDDVYIRNNTFISSVMNESPIWITGQRWNIEYNNANMSGSSNGYVDGIGFVKTHNISADTKSIVSHNTIIGDYFFPLNTRSYFKYYQNNFLDATTRIGYTDYPYPTVTSAERLAMPIKSGAQQTVSQTDGAAAMGTYTVINGAWVKQ